MEFWKSKDSDLGKILVFMFGTWAWYQFSWSAYTLKELHIVAGGPHWCIANMPAVASSIIFVIYNFRKTLGCYCPIIYLKNKLTKK